MSANSQFAVPIDAGNHVALGGLGVIFKISNVETSGRLCVVEHPLLPGHLAGPPHTHSRQDEYSFVLEGDIGVMIGAEVFAAPAGTYVLKPRGIPHAFWNAGTNTARILEIISPAGFESYFVDVAEVLAQEGPPDVSKLVE